VNVLQRLAAENLEAAIDVMNGAAKQDHDNGIPAAAIQTADEIILPVHTPTADERQLRCQLVQQQRDLAKLELLIGGREGDQVLGRRGEAGLQRATVAAIGKMLDQPEIKDARG